MARGGRHWSDKCRLQPLRSSPAREGASHLQPSAGFRSQLPVIVLVHSAGGTDEDDDDDDDDEDEGQDDKDAAGGGDAGAHAGRQRDSTERNVPNGSEIHDNAPDNWRTRPRSKANSLAHLELARRTKSIVITFNYRIGLLGYLPYADSDEKRHRSAQTVRSNHALWDQIGLLHWVRHNVAYFGGEPANVSLMSANSEAVQMVQLLALSPMAKGLFKRLILIHDEPAETPDPNAYFERLFWMAQRARPLQRKLITELGLLLERQHDEHTNGTAQRTSSSNNQNHNPAGELHRAQANIEIDRRVLELLKTGSLEQLAELELGVSEINVAAQFATTIRLADVINSPNLDDKLLFAHFSPLLTTTAATRAANESMADSAGAPNRLSRQGFWSWLAGSLDDHHQKLGQQADQPIWAGPLENFQLEAEYCGYMRRLYRQMLDPDRQADATPKQNRSLASELKRIDPLRLIPRVSDQQLAMIISRQSSAGRSQTKSLSHHSDPNQLNSTEAALTGGGDRRHQTGKQFVKWRRRNRTANAFEFYHLRHAHLLQHLLTKQKGDEFHQNSADSDHLAEELNQMPSSRAAANQDEEEAEEEDELDEWLVTRLQRQQQQRSIMLAQHQHSSQEPAPGYLPLRARRHATRAAQAGGDSLEPAGGSSSLAQQLVELLSGFDLLILFRGSPLVNAASQDNAARSVAPSLLEYISMSLGKSLSKSMASYIQMADLHYVASLRSSPENLNSLCEFSTRSNFLRRSEVQMANSYVLVEPRRAHATAFPQSDSDETSFTCTSKQRGRQTALDLIGQFARLGSFETLGGGATNSSQRFDTLERNLCWSHGVEASEKTLVGKVISAQMNLAAYLRRVLDGGSTRSAANTQEASENELLEQPSLAPADLVNCLLELDSISRAPGGEVSRRHPQAGATFRLTQDDCLLNATNRLRSQLRADAAEELEPLIRQYFVISEQQRQRQQLAASGRNSEQMPRDAAAASESAAAAPGDRRASTMTTRTLANQSEEPYLDQLASVSLSAGPQGRSQQLERELTNLVGGNQQFDVASNGSAAASMHSGGIRGYFAKTYKDAVGQALGIVIGTGSLIILLNLLIVLVIAWRSRRNLGRLEGQNGHNTRQAVQDCSNAAVNVAVPYNFGLDQSHLIGESLSNSMDCQQQALIDSVLELNQSLSDQQQQQQQQVSGCDFQTQLSSSTSFNVDPSHQLQMSRAQTCSSISSNSQRAAAVQNGKSIKFDLSGSGGRTLSRKATAGGKCQRGIMKQPATTSDEEEQLQQRQRRNQHETTDVRTMMVEGLCDTHYHQYRANEQQSGPDAACARELAISPVSLDVLDLIPLENLTSGYDGHELALVSNSSDDYQQMAAGCNFGLVAGSNSMQAAAKCPHGHEATDQMQWQQHKSQLRGGSLTSPYGSQSTHSTTSASNANGHGSSSFGVNKTSLHVPDLSPRRAALPAGPHSFCPAPAKLSMNSPPSSATISGGHTPNSVGNQQLYYTLHGPVAIGEQNRTGSGTCQANRSQVMVYRTDSLKRGDAGGNVTIDSLSSYGRLIMLPAEISNDKKINNDSL